MQTEWEGSKAKVGGRRLGRVEFQPPEQPVGVQRISVDEKREC